MIAEHWSRDSTKSTPPKPHWQLPTLCGLKVNHGSLWLPTSKFCISSFSGLRLCFSKCVLGALRNCGGTLEAAEGAGLQTHLAT